MARKEIPEEEKNYNKFPGEHVVMLDETIMVGKKTFQLVKNYRDAFNVEKLEQRYNEILNKYDYIVGDWGYEMLRLKGFYNENHKQGNPDEKIDHLADYLQEYCNYGCAYFVLKRLRAEGEKDEIPDYEVEDSRNRSKRHRNRARHNGRERNQTREKKENVKVNKKITKKSVVTNKLNFTIRKREE